MGLVRNRKERIKSGHKEREALVLRDSRTFLLENMGWIVPKLLSLSISVPYLVAAWNSKSTSPSSHVISLSPSMRTGTLCIFHYHSGSEVRWYFHIILCLIYYNHFWSLCRLHASTAFDFSDSWLHLQSNEVWKLCNYGQDISEWLPGTPATPEIGVSNLFTINHRWNYNRDLSESLHLHAPGEELGASISVASREEK